MLQTTGTMSAHRKTCHFSGRVQGVGFRYTAQNIAIQHDVRGYVRNLSDGRVELVLEGPDAEMDRVITGLQRRMQGFIGKTVVSEAPATGEYDRFCIRH
jgi:acylphosphatase